MLTNDPKRLRLLGIDLHSRGRRRAAVVITYLGYFILMIVLDDRFEPDVSLWLKYLCMFATTIFFMSSGVFNSSGPVKRMTEQANYYRDMVLLRGLDDWSRYLYGGNYESLAADQQHDVLMRYKVGGYLLPASRRHPGFDSNAPDERELAERNRAYVRALQLMTIFLFSLTGIMMQRMKMILASSFGRSGHPRSRTSDQASPSTSISTSRRIVERPEPTEILDVHLRTPSTQQVQSAFLPCLRRVRRDRQ
jgi:hypothetical protein